MEFKIKQNVLKDELGFIQGVVERKTTIPVLSNILIESIGENEIRIVGTDLDCTIRCDAEAEIISQEPCVCRPANYSISCVCLIAETFISRRKTTSG